MDNQVLWRIAISAWLGCMAAGVAALAALLWAAIRRDVRIEIPITAGMAVGIAAYLIDWYTERRGART